MSNVVSLCERRDAYEVDPLPFTTEGLRRDAEECRKAVCRDLIERALVGCDPEEALERLYEATGVLLRLSDEDLALIREQQSLGVF
jgi:hypothetical protein